jgi:hypothetical protein
MGCTLKMFGVVASKRICTVQKKQTPSKSLFLILGEIMEKHVNNIEYFRDSVIEEYNEQIWQAFKEEVLRLKRVDSEVDQEVIES